MSQNINDYLPSRFWLMKTEPDVFSIDDLLQWQEQKNFGMVCEIIKHEISC